MLAGSGSVVFLTLGPYGEQSFEGKSLHDVKRTLDCIHTLVIFIYSAIFRVAYSTSSWKKRYFLASSRGSSLI